jgi:hypothetical protein
MFPVLDEYAKGLDGHTLQIYRWLQYGSSVIGLLIVIAAIILWLRHAPKPAKPPLRRLSHGERRAWTAFYLIVPVLAMALLLVLWRGRPESFVPMASGLWLGKFANAGMRGSIVSLVLVSLLLCARIHLLSTTRRS